MKYLNLAWNYLKIGISSEMQYRANFFIQLLQSFIALGTGLIGLALVFSFTSNLGGWSPPELLVVVGVYTLMNGVIASAIQPNMLRLLDEIGDGTLDFALTKPVDAQVLVSLREFRFWELTDALVGLVVMAVGTAQLQRDFGVWQALAVVAALFLGGVILYSFWLILTSVAFRATRVYALVELFQGVYAAGRWPVTIYPDWLQAGLTFIVPVAFAVTVPAEALTNRLTGLALLGEAALALLFVGLARLVWRLSIRTYSGASS